MIAQYKFFKSYKMNRNFKQYILVLIKLLWFPFFVYFLKSKRRAFKLIHSKLNDNDDDSNDDSNLKLKSFSLESYVFYMYAPLRKLILKLIYKKYEYTALETKVVNSLQKWSLDITLT